MAQQSGGMPYIGSLISLISKTGVRYEGTLYTIDMQESTIALQDGTEPTTAHVVCPRSQWSAPTMLQLQFALLGRRDGSRMAPRSLPAINCLSLSDSGVGVAVYTQQQIVPAISTLSAADLFRVSSRLRHCRSDGHHQRSPCMFRSRAMCVLLACLCVSTTYICDLAGTNPSTTPCSV